MESWQERLEDAAYIAVGAAVLAYQRARVHRREVERWVERARREVEELLDQVAAEGPPEGDGAPPTG